jgi:flagella basal body P-ring formation protein FlgA
MRNKILPVILIGSLLNFGLAETACAEPAEAPAPQAAGTLQIYLPREVTVDGNVPDLGHVGVMRGDEQLVARAAKITLGKLALPGQTVVIDRPVLLSRLASNGIPASKVQLTGADKVIVKQTAQAVSTAQFLQFAREFLAKSLPAQTIAQIEVLHAPDDLVLIGAGRDVKLTPRVVKTPLPGQARVEVDVLVDGRLVGSRQVQFRLKFNCRRAVALSDIPAGAAITPQNVKLEPAVADSPDPADWASPYGLLAKRPIPADTVIRPSMVAPAQPQVVLRRNQSVLIRIESTGILVTATGKALEEGKIGDFVKVQNVDSQRTIIVKINTDGTVSPVL